MRSWALHSLLLPVIQPQIDFTQHELENGDVVDTTERSVPFSSLVSLPVPGSPDSTCLSVPRPTGRPPGLSRRSVCPHSKPVALAHTGSKTDGLIATRTNDIDPRSKRPPPSRRRTISSTPRRTRKSRTLRSSRTTSIARAVSRRSRRSSSSASEWNGVWGR